jgi:hypothetical protein
MLLLLGNVFEREGNLAIAYKRVCVVLVDESEPLPTSVFTISEIPLHLLAGQDSLFPPPFSTSTRTSPFHA